PHAEEFAQTAAVQSEEALFHRHDFQSGCRGPRLWRILHEDRGHQAGSAWQDQCTSDALETKGNRAPGGTGQVEQVEAGGGSVDRVDGPAVLLGWSADGVAARVDAG